MKKLSTLLLASTLTFSIQAQNIGINSTGATPNNSAIMDLNTGNTFTGSNGKGLLTPNVALTSVTDAITVTSPATSLLVYNTASAGSGTAAVVPSFYYWDGIKWVKLQTSNSAAQDWNLLGNAATTPSVNFLGTTDNNDLVFRTNNVERVRILSGGKVGIGTNLPAGQLEVSLNSNTTSDAISKFYRNGTGSVGFIQLHSGAFLGDYSALVNTGDKSIIFTNDNNPSLDDNTGLVIAPWTATANPTGDRKGLKIMENGNVGIGVPNPAARLEVSSGLTYPSLTIGTMGFSAPYHGLCVQGVGTVSNYSMLGDGTNLYINRPTGGTMYFRENNSGTEQMVIRPNGKVRINTTGVATTINPAATDNSNISFEAGGGYTRIGNFNSDAVFSIPSPGSSFSSGVGALAIGMNRQSGTSNADFWNTTDDNQATANSSADRGFSWRRYDQFTADQMLMNLNGLGDLTITGTNYFSSDKRLKTQIKPIENLMIDKIMKLKPSRYFKTASAYNADGTLLFYPQNENSVNDFGFIAQEVYDVLPELVSKPKNESKELWAVDYSRLSVILTKAMQEQQLQIEELKKEIELLKKK